MPEGCVSSRAHGHAIHERADTAASIVVLPRFAGTISENGSARTSLRHPVMAGLETDGVHRAGGACRCSRGARALLQHDRLGRSWITAVGSQLVSVEPGGLCA